MIPKKIHFIYISKPEEGGLPFSFCYWAAVQSAMKCNPCYEIHFWYEYEPNSRYFQDLKNRIILHKIEAPKEIYGNPVPHYAHKADILRLQILLEHGGIYLDLDTITVKPYDFFLDKQVVMSIVKNNGNVFGLGNSVIMGEPQNQFMKRWYETYKTFRSTGHDQYYDEHGAGVSYKLATQFPNEITVFDETLFLTPDMTPAGITELFLTNGEFPNAFCHHLWGKNSEDIIDGLNENNYEIYPSLYSRQLKTIIGEEIQNIKLDDINPIKLIPIIPKNSPIALDTLHVIQNRFADLIVNAKLSYVGRGIVISIYDNDFPNAWVLLNELVRLNVNLPVEVWSLPGELSEFNKNIIQSLDIDISFHVIETKVSKYAVKPFAVYCSSFEEVLWLDNDCFPIRDPNYLFDDPEYQIKGTMLWRDVCGADRAHYWHMQGNVWKIFNIPYNDAEECDSGQMLHNKSLALPALLMAMYFNQNGHVYYKGYEERHADKDTYKLACQFLQFKKLKELRSFGYLADPNYSMYGFMPFGPFHMGLPNPWHKWGGGSVMVQRDREGKPIFNHRNLFKFSTDDNNVRHLDVANEEYYHQHIEKLRSILKA